MQLSSSILADARLQKNQFKFVKITSQHQKQSNSTCRGPSARSNTAKSPVFWWCGVDHANEGHWGLNSPPRKAGKHGH